MREPAPGRPRVGVLVPPHIPAGHAQRAEQLGFAEIWVAEDCFLHDAFAQAATVLATTTSLHVGMGIIPAAAHNVAFTAMKSRPWPGCTPAGSRWASGTACPADSTSSAPGRPAR